MAIDINDTRTMLAALERSYPPTTLLRDTFFPNLQTFVTETVDIDYRKGGRQLSPFVTGDSSGVNVKRAGFDTKNYKPPMMMPKRPITRDTIAHRGFGEPVYSTRTPAQRAMEVRIRDLAEFRDMNTRTIEWMCAQIMLFGSVEIHGYADDGETYLVDTVTYSDWTQKDILAGTDTWDNTNADIYGDLKFMHQTIAENAGINPGVAIFPNNVEGYILNNERMQKYLDIRNMYIANIQPRIVAPGVRYFGTITSLDLQLWVYNGIYQDKDGVRQQYIPNDYVLMGVTGRGSQLFGAITQLEGKEWFTYEGRDVPKVWSEEGKDAQFIRLASRCVPKPEFADDWYTLKVK